MGLTHYDDPPPDHIDDLEAWRATDKFRFANRLAAWVEVDGDAITGAGYAEDSHGLMGATTLRLGPGDATFAAVGLDDIRRPPEPVEGGVRFVQTVGGRTAVPAPRHVNRPPFVRLQAPVVWTTLALTLRADRTAAFEVAGASRFPRHWVYGDDGELVAKVGVADFRGWYHDSQNQHTPWGDEDTPALITAVETALERELSHQIMRQGRQPRIRSVKTAACLCEQGAEGNELFLLLDGVLAVEVDGTVVAEVGPGAVLGERAALESGRRTSTLKALTPVRVALATVDELAPEALGALVEEHRREDDPPPAANY